LIDGYEKGRPIQERCKESPPKHEKIKTVHQESCWRNKVFWTVSQYDNMSAEPLKCAETRKGARINQSHEFRLSAFFENNMKVHNIYRGLCWVCVAWILLQVRLCSAAAAAASLEKQHGGLC
jgi:hypothetical protein